MILIALGGTTACCMAMFFLCQHWYKVAADTRLEAEQLVCKLHATSKLLEESQPYVYDKFLSDSIRYQLEENKQ